MTKYIIPAAAALSILTLPACNIIARHYGGSITVEVSKDEKLVNASWKGESLWILTRSRKEGEKPETFQYKENSAYGVLEGTVTIVEK